MKSIKDLLIVVVLAHLVLVTTLGGDAYRPLVNTFKTDDLHVVNNAAIDNNLSVPNGVASFYRTRQSTVRLDSNVGKLLAAGANNNVDVGAGQSGADRINFTSNAAGSTMSGMYAYVGAGEFYVCTNTGGTLTILDDSNLSDPGNRYQLAAATAGIGDGASWIQWWDGVFWHIAGL